MAKQGGAIARFLIKWLVIPVGLAAVGFFFVGPRLGAPSRPSPDPAPTQEDAKESTSSKFKGQPEVEISARPVARRKPPRRRNRPAAAPSNEAPAPSEAPDAEPPARDGEPPAGNGDG